MKESRSMAPAIWIVKCIALFGLHANAARSIRTKRKHALCKKMCLIVLLAASGEFSAFAQRAPFGIETRAPNTTLLIQNLPAGAPTAMQVTRVFDQLTFNQPVFLTEIPDQSTRMALVEKSGRIHVFPKSANPLPADVSLFLDISGQVIASGEQGLLGLAFDPDYASNGRLYVYYSKNTTSPGTSTISRFTNSTPSGNSVNIGTEEIILQIVQPYTNHNGGMIAFGPDNMLYIALGDGGSGGDPLNSGQDTSTLLGNILRIDVRSLPDTGLAYGIPQDNPFIDSGTIRREIYAYGFRNPWRFSFDRINGFLIAGDVGQSTREEIDAVVSGGNYGWRIMEGTLCYNPPICNPTGLLLPLIDYGRDQGNSVTGGYVYFGNQVPDLYGMFVYGDYGSGRIWGLRYDGDTVQGPYVLVESSGLNISSFGQDESGEVYVLDIFAGGVYVLRPVTGGGFFPTHLSDIPALLQAGLGADQTTQGIIHYAPGAQLWSDGALKQRFMALANLDQMGYQQDMGWDFPENTVLIKNFLVPMDERNPWATAKRVETRLLYRKNALWHGFSYEWNEGQTDANLLWASKIKLFTILNGNGQSVTFDYLYPGRSQCIQCHTNAANGVLGLNTAQMNANFLYPASNITDNQLRTYDHIALFLPTAPLPDIPSNLPRMPDYGDATALLEDRSRAYLASNCSMCHRPGGPAPTSLDLRWGITKIEMNALDVAPGNGDLGIPNAKIISTSVVAESVLLFRMGLRDGLYQMPPLGTSRVDSSGYGLMETWIASLPYALVYVSQDDLTCGGHGPCFSSIQEAMNLAGASSLIKIRGGTYIEGLILNAAKSVTLSGRWSPDFTTQTGTATVISAPQVTAGKLTLQEVTVRSLP